MSKIIFPQGFQWGVATSACQIEGASDIDGKGYNIWDIFSRIPGKTFNGETPDPANDFYHSYESDISTLKNLNLNAFRMSLSWSRIMPSGKGAINSKGVDFYHRVLDKLLENNIMPNVTLYHWDLPQELQYELGWLNRDTANYFADFSSFVYKEFGDKVPMFATINEPIAVYVGYGLGAFAPGIRGEKFGRMANHNILRAHGLSVQAFRAANIHSSQIGMANDFWVKVPARPDDDGDVKLAHEANELSHLGYMNPIFKGKYSDFHLDWMERTGNMPEIKGGDMLDICQPLDFMGVNCYARTVVSTKEDEAKKSIEQGGGNFQQNGQEYYPETMYNVLSMLKSDFVGNMPMYVTENGAYQLAESVGENGQVNDQHRIQYIDGFLRQIHRAIDDGIDVRGYYVWTLYDNWEWTGASNYRFGIIHNDFATQKRTWKDSAHWYSRVAANNGIIE